MVIGDFNARMGDNVNKLIGNCASLAYNVVDPGVNYGREIFAICQSQELVLVNNLNTHFSTFAGALTFRQRKKWISELDLCIISKEVIDNIVRFSVDQNTSLPSNHAPIAVKIFFPECDLSLHQILTRSGDIGTYPTKPKQLCRPSVAYNRINHGLFRKRMSSINPTFATTLIL